MPKRIFATAVTKSHLADARTLAASLAAHHPDSELYVLLADRMEGMFDPIQEPFHLIQLSDLSDRDRIDRMCFYYNAFELCCALRGDLHEYLWQHTQVDRWLFLDADVWVCHSLEVIFQQLDQAEILLTPHNLQPTLPEHVELRELDFLKLGLYNGGCLGIRRGSASQQFIQWWKSRLTYYSFDDHGIKEIRGLHTDQYLLGLVPLYFDPVVLLRHPGANIGHWNLIDRHLEQTADGKFWVDGQPLLFLHLSGWDIEQPDRVSRYSLLYATYENPAWAILGQCYRAELLSHGYRETRQWSYAFANFETGQPISLAARRAYYHEWQQGQALPASPFQQASLLATASYPTLTSVILLQEERANLMVKLMEQQESTHLAWTKVEELMEMQKDLHHQIQLQDQQIQNLNAQTQALNQQNQALNQQNQALNQQNQALNQQNQLLVQSGQSLLQDIRAISSETVSEPTIAAALTSLRHHKFWRVWKFWVATKNWLKTQITQRRSR